MKPHSDSAIGRLLDVIGEDVPVGWMGLAAAVYVAWKLFSFNTFDDWLSVLPWLLPVIVLVAIRIRQRVQEFWLTMLVAAPFGLLPYVAAELASEKLVSAVITIPLLAALLPRSHPLMVTALVAWLAVAAGEVNVDRLVPESMQFRTGTAFGLMLLVALREPNQVKLPWDHYRKFAWVPMGIAVFATAIVTNWWKPAFGVVAASPFVFLGCLLAISVGNNRESKWDTVHYFSLFLGPVLVVLVTLALK